MGLAGLTGMWTERVGPRALRVGVTSGRAGTCRRMFRAGPGKLTAQTRATPGTSCRNSGPHPACRDEVQGAGPACLSHTFGPSPACFEKRFGASPANLHQSSRARQLATGFLATLGGARAEFRAKPRNLCRNVGPRAVGRVPGRTWQFTRAENWGPTRHDALSSWRLGRHASPKISGQARRVSRGVSGRTRQSYINRAAPAIGGEVSGIHRHGPPKVSRRGRARAAHRAKSRPNLPELGANFHMTLAPDFGRSQAPPQSTSGGRPPEVTPKS